MTGLSPPPRPTASVLRHDCADGSWHYDWLLALRTPQGPDDRCALAWRVQERPDMMAPGTRQPAVALPPHRALYLELPAPTDLSGGRGRVRPIACGDATLGPTAGGDAPTTVRIQWRSGAALHYRISTGPGDACVECVQVEPQP